MDNRIIKYIQTVFFNLKYITIYFNDIECDEYVFIIDAVLFDETNKIIQDNLSKQYNHTSFLRTPVNRRLNNYSISYDTDIRNGFEFFVSVKIGHFGKVQKYRYKYDGYKWNEMADENYLKERGE